LTARQPVDRLPFLSRLPLGRVFLFWLVGVVVLTLVLVSGLVLDHLDRVLVAELETHARVLARTMAVAVAEGRVPAELPEAVLGDVRSVEVRREGGALLWRLGPAPEEVEALDRSGLTVRENVTVVNGAKLQVVLRMDTTRIRRHLAAAAVRLVAGMGLALAAALVVGLAAVAAVVRPLRRLADHAREIGPEHPWPRPEEIGGSSETVELARALSEMGDRLAAQRRSLRASERRFRDLFESSPTPILELGADLAVTGANPAAAALIGDNPSGSKWMDRLDEPSPEAVRRRLAELAEGEAASFEGRWLLPDGEPAEVELRTRCLASGTEPAWLLAVHDQTDRVRRMGELWRRTFDAMTDGVALLGPDGAVGLANHAFAPFSGAVVEQAAARLQRGDAGEWEVSDDGRIFACTLTLPRGLDHGILVVRDRTEAASAATRLREAEKMRAVGTLASGIAHDFNNLLAGIQLNLRLIERDPKSVVGAAAAIRDLAEQGSEVVGELLLFARRETTPLRSLDLADLVRQQADLLRHLLPSACPFAVTTPPGPVRVEGNPVALRRMLLNLVLNARDAVAGGHGGIEVSLGAWGDEAELEVADHGVGISPEVRERLFEPFFTQRPTGRGAGLGLAVVYAVVTEHGGRITVDSQPGSGTRVRVMLPLARSGPVAAVERTPTLDGRRVLVIERDPSRAAAVVEALVVAGADARHARSPEEATRLGSDWRPEAVVIDSAGPRVDPVPTVGELDPVPVVVRREDGAWALGEDNAELAGESARGRDAWLADVIETLETVSFHRLG
jgi:PAS domain S-box-containing protein